MSILSTSNPSSKSNSSRAPQSTDIFTLPLPLLTTNNESLIFSMIWTLASGLKPLYTSRPNNISTVPPYFATSSPKAEAKLLLLLSLDPTKPHLQKDTFSVSIGELRLSSAKGNYHQRSWFQWHLIHGRCLLQITQRFRSIQLKPKDSPRPCVPK